MARRRSVLTRKQDGDFDPGSKEVGNFGERDKVTDMCCESFQDMGSDRGCRDRVRLPVGAVPGREDEDED